MAKNVTVLVEYLEDTYEVSYLSEESISTVAQKCINAFFENRFRVFEISF